MDNYQHILSLEAQKRKVDGVICNHIHHAGIAQMEFGKTYCNCGDWVESCTALVEDEAGHIYYPLAGRKSSFIRHKT